jgi:hypothetical protein
MEDSEMRQFNLLLAGMAMFMFAAGLIGCGDASTSDQTASSQTGHSSETEPAEHAAEGNADHGDHADHGDAETIKESLAQLSHEDRATAEQQKDCPVSGESLGSMGKPIKMTVKDTDVWICCAGCKDKLTGDPNTYLAKLKKK